MTAEAGSLTLGDLGRAVALLDQNIATLGAESGGDSTGQSLNALEQLGTGLDTELELLQGCQSVCRGIDVGAGCRFGAGSHQAP